MPRLIPISLKASNILKNKMGDNPKVKVEKRVGNKILFSSFDGKYCGWVDLAKDPDWAVVLKSC